MAATDFGVLPLPLEFQTEELSVYKPRDYLYVMQTRKILGVSIYVLIGSESALVMDAGIQLTNFKATLKRVTDKPLIMALTHGHVDHTGGIYEFDEVYMDEADKNLIPEYKGKTINIRGGYKFDLGGIDVEVVDMQGHTPGSIGFLDKTHRLLFTGDAIGADAVWMHLTPLPLESVLGVLRHLVSIKDQWDEIWPGHYDRSNSVLKLDYVETMERLVNRIVQGEEVELKEDKESQERFNLPFTPVRAYDGKVGVIFNQQRKHYV